MKFRTPNNIFRFFHGTLFHHSKKKNESTNNALRTEEFERCIICGALTHIPVSTPIDWRENYELGCGQFCVECAKKQGIAAECENTLTNAQILLAVEQSKKENNK